MCQDYLKKVAVVAVVSCLTNLSFGTIHTDFAAGMQRNGSASASPGSLWVADYYDKGSAFWWQKQDVSGGFTTEFSFTNGRGSSANGNYVTGFAFVIQNQSIDALGSNGNSSLGYNGIEQALAIEFDLTNNPKPFSYNHLAIQCGGTGPVSSDHNAALAYSSYVQDLKYDHTARITYADNHLKVWVDPETWTEAWLDIEIDISNSLGLTDGQAWVGFAGASNRGFSVIHEWDFVEQVPEPATMSLLVLGSVLFRKRYK